MTTTTAPLKASRRGSGGDQLISGLVALTILVGLIQLALGRLNAGGLVRYFFSAVSNDRVYEQLTKTETIELIGADRAYRAELEVFAATRKAVHDAQGQD